MAAPPSLGAVLSVPVLALSPGLALVAPPVLALAAGALADGALVPPPEVHAPAIRASAARTDARTRGNGRRSRRANASRESCRVMEGPPCVFGRDRKSVVEGE